MALQTGGATSDYIQVADHAGIRAQRPLTIACWMKRAANGDLDTLFNIRQTGNHGWRFLIQSSNKISITFWGVAEQQSAGSVPTGDVHVAMTMDASGNINYYINGAADSTDTMGAPGSTTNPGYIGVELDSSGVINAANVAEFWEHGIWTRELSAAEIAVLAAGYSPLFVPGSLTSYIPGVRTAQDRRTGATVTENGSITVVPHRKVFNPAPPQIIPVTAGGAPPVITTRRRGLLLTGVGG